MPVRYKIGQWLDRTIALLLAMLMIGIAIGNVAYGEDWGFWAMYLQMGLCHTALLAASRFWTLLLYFFLVWPGWFVAYVVCDIAQTNPALDIHHAIHESVAPIILFFYSLARAIQEFLASDHQF